MGRKTNPADDRRDNGDDDREIAWGAGLKGGYDEVAHEPLPDRFVDLLKQLEDAEASER